MINIRKAMEIEGWATVEELAWLADKARLSLNILEIGSWAGRTSRALAENTKGSFTSIDTWEGDAGRDGLILDPSLAVYALPVFDFNMSGLNNVRRFRMSSTEAESILSEESFDMIFLDVSYEESALASEISRWIPMLSESGIMCGLEYGGMPGVKKALKLSAPMARPARVGKIWVLLGSQKQASP